jgi:sigma-E factor negative regulatory protein RseC
MEEMGRVISIEGDGTAIVAVERTEACKTCRACLTSEDGQLMLARAINLANAVEGDEVEIIIESKSMLTAAFLIYILPLIFFGLGYVFGWYIPPLFSSSISAESSGIFFGFVLCAVSFIIIAAIDRKVAKSYHFKPVVRKVVSK